MNTYRSRKENGFTLIVIMLILLVLTILVVNAVRGSVMGEKMAGSYMDRNRAMQAAEQALQQGKARLMTLDAANAPICLSGCQVAANGTVTAIAPGVEGESVMPNAWSDANAVHITQAAGQATDASYHVVLLNDALRALDKVSANCKAYSIMSRGGGIDNRTTVVLQTVAYVCPT